MRRTRTHIGGVLGGVLDDSVGGTVALMLVCESCRRSAVAVLVVAAGVPFFVCDGCTPQEEGRHAGV